MSEQITLKDKIGIIKRSLKLINTADKGHTFRAIIGIVPDVITEYAGIYLAALVIDGVTASKPLPWLLTAAAVVCGVDLLVLLLRHVINARSNSHGFAYSQNTGRFIWKKVLNIDYTQVENIETQNKRQNAMNWISNGNMGIPALENHVCYIIRGIISIILGIILIVPFVFVPSVVTGGFVGFVQSVWGFAAVIAAVVVLTGLQAVVFTPMATKEMEKVRSNPEILQADRVRQFCMAHSIYDYRNGKDIRIYNEQDLLIGKYWSARRQIEKGWMICAGKAIEMNTLSNILHLLIQVLLYGFAVIRASSGMISSGEVVAFVMYFTRIKVGISELSGQISDMLVKAPLCQQVFDFLDIPDEKYKGSIPTEKRDDNEYEFEFKHVYFKYPGAEQYVLRDINLKWRIGEKMALVGKNGSGKSTLVKLLCRLYDPTEGEITLNGVDIRKYKYEEYMDLFSVVFQDSKMFSFSIAENVAADTDYDRVRVEDCVRRAGFSGRLDSMEKGIETCLYKDFDEKGVEISGGEAQKLCLARAVYKGAPFIVLDEPTAALDPVSEHDIYTRFNSIVGTRTAIYISHRLSSCRFCDDITVLENGRIVERGSHEKLLAEGGAYSRLWSAQAEYYRDTAGELFAL